MISQILHIRIRENASEAFAAWQEMLHAHIALCEGFISLEILSPKDPRTSSWTIIEHFSSGITLSSWQHSIAYQTLQEQLAPLCIECKQEVTSTADIHNGVTEVFVTKVSHEQMARYQKWVGKIHKAEATFTGFQRVYVQAPKDHLHDTWITLLQFDTKENLDRWLNSDVRMNILQEAESLITSIESHRVASPFGGWFGRAINRESLWKETMLILLVLYPIVMLQMKFLSPFTANLQPALAMFIANSISVTLITWPCMPICLYFLRWWLTPKNTQASLLGTLLVLALYAIEIALFW